MKTHYPIGLSSRGGKPLDEAAFAAMKNSGLEVIEIARSDYDNFDFATVKAFSDKYGIGIWTLHLPYMPFEKIDISSTDITLRKSTLDIFDDIIKRAAAIGIDKFVVHPSGEPIAENMRESRIECSMQSLDHLAGTAARNGAVIAVENLPRSCVGRNSDEILRLISANDKLRVCFDVNHLLNEESCAFAERVAERIVTLHISDYDFKDEKHWLPGEGDIRWHHLLKTLHKIGYNGAWMYEVSFEASDTIERRRLTYSDFYDNAVTLFSGSVPDAIGIRKV